MIESVKIVDNFCSRIDEVRASALASGFGTWAPNKGEVGSSNYEGMSFWGLHSYMIASLSAAMKSIIFPNNMFFRITNEGMEKAYVHSDRESGAITCVAYVSDHKDVTSGTGFYRHRETGALEMPSFAEMRANGTLAQRKKEMVEGSPDVWEQTDFVRGIYNRALIFRAPLFHSRWPREGIGADAEKGRMVWVCHFHTPETL